MPFTFRKRIQVIPGFLTWNLNTHSRSWTFRFGPFHYTTSSTGRRTESVDLPGPWSWRKTTNRRNRG